MIVKSFCPNNTYSLFDCLEYFISDENKVCEDVGAIPLVDEMSCKMAVEQIKKRTPKKYYAGSSTDSDYPKGCYLYNFGNKVYFNPHETGARDDYAQPICQISNGI